MAGGMFLFSAVDTHAKFLSDSFHPIQIAWSRQLGLFVGVLFLLVIRGSDILKTQHPYLQIGRGALAAGSATLFIVAISIVPLADAIAISFVAPFIVTLLGALILGEAVGIRRWVAVSIGFLGTPGGHAARNGSNPSCSYTGSGRRPTFCASTDIVPQAQRDRPDNNDRGLYCNNSQCVADSAIAVGMADAGMGI